MNKYLHVDGDDGSIRVENHVLSWFENGWVYEVPDSFEIVLNLQNMADHIYIYELLNDHDGAKLVRQS